MLSNRDLLNKKRMATLQELEKNFNEVKSNVDSLQKQMREVKKEIKKYDEIIKSLDKEIGHLMNSITGAKSDAELVTDPAKKKEYKARAKKQEAKLVAKQKEKADLETKRASKLSSKLSIEQKIADSQVEMDKILAEFAQDPRINQHLQEAIKIEFNKADIKLENEITVQENLATKLGKDLADDNVFGTEVKAFVDATNAKNSINPYVTDPNIIKENEKIQDKFRNALFDLNRAIKSRPEYANIELTQEDYESIIAGPKSGTYQLPSMEKAVKVLEAKKQKMEAEKTKIIADIEKEKAVAGKVDLSQIDADITAKEGEIKAKEASIQNKKTEITNKELEIKAKEQNSTDLDTKIGEISAKEPRLKELQDKTKISQDLIDDENKTKTEYDKALQELKAVGYISKDTIPELGDDTSAISNAYKEFVAKDLAVRKAFAECKVNPDKSKMAELQTAINEYEKESKDLASTSGFSVIAWNKYLMSELNKKIADGQNIDEAYNTGLINSRVKNLGELYKKYFDEDDQSLVERSANTLKNMDELQQQILSGKKGSADFPEVGKVVENYHTSMKEILDSLTYAGVKGINKIGDLYNIIKGSLTQKVGFFKRMFSKKYQDPAQPEFDVKYQKGTSDLSEKLTTAKENYEAAKKAKDDALAGKLSPEEQKELADLKTEFAEKTKMEADKATIDGEITTLTGEKDTLQQDVQKLENDTTLKDELQALKDEREKRAKAGVPPVSNIKNPEEIAHGAAKKLVTAKLKEPKKIISDIDRDER